MATSAEIRAACGIDDCQELFEDLPRSFPSNDIEAVLHYHAPLKVQFEITRKCNLWCKHCYNRSGPREASELTERQWQTITHECLELGVCHIALTGGEPFVRQGIIFDVLDSCEHSGTAVSITTNGILLTQAIIDHLQHYRCLFKVQVSLDGATPRTHDALRGKPGAWASAVRGIARLRSLPISVAVACILMKPNVKEVENIVDLSYEMGADRVSFGHLMAMGRASDHMAELELTIGEYRNIIDQLKRCRIRYGDKIKILMAYDNELNSYIDFAGPNSTCIVRADGEVAARCYLSDSVGSIKEESIACIWKSKLISVHENPAIFDRLREDRCLWTDCDSTSKN